MKLGVYGQVSRLLNLADDGKSTKAYFVDNDISVSRIGAKATGQVTDDLSIGTVLELAISPNNSDEVSQINEDGSQKDEFRKAEAVFGSKTYGDVYFGRGDPATKDITRIDLSGTDILAYASTGDPAGGLLFRTKDGDDLTTTLVAQFDSLGMPDESLALLRERVSQGAGAEVRLHLPSHHEWHAGDRPGLGSVRPYTFS